MANTDWSYLKFVADQLNHEFKLFNCQTKTRTKTNTTATRLLLTLGKYRKAPRIDYGVKHKASLLIMRIYTCVLMLYKGRRSRTHPVYSLFKFQTKFMFCKCKTVFLLLV